MRPCGFGTITTRMSNELAPDATPATTRRGPARALHRARRWAWLLVAYASAAVALAGAVVPILPTTPFALLAVYAAARGSDRLHRYLLSHRVLGPLLADWRRDRAVRRGAKQAATASMAVSAVVVVLTAPSLLLAAAVAALLTAVATWLWLRPEPQPAAADGA
jgi:uncharacterized membrane protein YbaN (DUF454 family)